MPDWKPSLVARLASLRLTPAREREIIEELSQHLDDIYQDRLGGGASHVEAMRRALDELDERDLLARGLLPLKQASAPSPMVPGAGRRDILADMVQDLSYAIRSLMHARGWATVVILLLALGIGSNTALFTAADALMLSSIPARDPGSLVRFQWTGRNDAVTEQDGYGFVRPLPDGQRVSASMSYPVYQEFQRSGSSRVDLFAIVPASQISVNIDGQAELAHGLLASGAYFQIVGVDAAAGRLFGIDDDRVTAPPVAVISARFWRSRFGETPAVIGKVVKVNDVPVTIIGVTAASFTGVQEPLDAPPDITLPLQLDRQIKASTGRSDSSLLTTGTAWWLLVGGRLKPGVTASQLEASLQPVFEHTARANLDAYLKGLSDQQRGSLLNRARHDVPKMMVSSAEHGLYDLNDDVVTQTSLLSVVVVLILLIICANVANLMLSRAIGRQKEISVRLSLGATRGRLIQQLLTEALLLASIGALGGLVVAFWGVKLTAPTGAPVSIFHARILLFTALATVLTSLIFGMVPALRATRVDVNTGLKDTSRGVAGRRNLLARSLLVVQVALSLVLLVGAGLFLRTLTNLRHVDVGFDPQNLLLVTITPRVSGYDQTKANDLYARLLDRFGGVAGVRGCRCRSPRFSLAP